jgi:signal transduction histidine kinase
MMSDIMQNFFTTRNFWISLIIISSVLSILVAIVCLSHGIYDLFYFFFLIPMLLVIYRFPENGVLFTVAMGWINITLVYAFGSVSSRILAVQTAWFYIYVSLGIVISSIVVNSRIRQEKIDQLKTQAFQQIEQNLEQFEILNDQIRNPLQAILLESDTQPGDPETKDHISDHVHAIEKILSRLDQRILESQKVRKFLRTHYDFTIK